MTTLRQIITDAYREGGIIQIGTTPEADQLDEGLRKLQSFISQLFGHELGESFEVVSYGEASNGNSYLKDYDQKSYLDTYYIPSNIRLLVNSSSAQTVYLNPNPQAGARFSVVDMNGSFSTGNFTIKGNGRKIENASQLVLNTNGTNTEWFYRDDLADWVKVTDLTENDQSPFPSEFDELLITGLAIRLNPRYQEQTTQETMMTYRQARSRFRSRYKQSEFSPSDVSRLFWNGFTNINPTTAFNRGMVSK